MRSRLDCICLPAPAIAILALCVAAPLAHAHALNLFATVTDGVVNGKTYYADGPAAGIQVTVFGPNDEALGTAESGDDGSFTWTPTTRGNLHFVAETPEGHRAEFTVSAEELPETLPKAEGVAEISQSDGSDRSVGLSQPHSAAEPHAGIEQIVEDAVSRQIRPLREQIDAFEHRTRFRDIVGGLGYIVGVSGLFAFWKSRTKRNET